MRIGIMLRSIDEKGGIGIYSRYITKELLDLDQKNEYVLFYANGLNLGRFEQYDHVTERYVKASNKVLWDQFYIPWACRREKIDVLFHPKFTVPLLAPCKTVMVLHGAGWFMPEFQNFWDPMDLKYVKAMMPIYSRKASAVLSVSKVTTDTFNKEFNLPLEKVKTVYFAPGRHFKRIADERLLHTVRMKYDLPERFIFTLSGYDRGDRKNIAGIFKSYEINNGKFPHKLVIGGKDCNKFKTDFGLLDDGYGKDVLFLGWIEQEDLPAIYSMADLFLYPSNVEAFPIPITEALACGTPIVTSNANGLLEIVGDAALLVDPNDSDDIAEAISRVLSDRDLHRDLSRKSLDRAKNYSWDKCAQETLEILRSVANK